MGPIFRHGSEIRAGPACSAVWAPSPVALLPLDGALLLLAKPSGSVNATVGGRCPRQGASKNPPTAARPCTLSLKFLSQPADGELTVAAQGAMPSAPVRLGMLYPLRDSVGFGCGIQPPERAPSFFFSADGEC